ncbi:hypothetical protein A5658_18495 [Mycobacterium sp. 1245111.1]|nr:hypothetical protein A5658_18495 [Mycobacterium sp. 1245111.1]
MPAGAASLRRVRGWDSFETSGSLLIETGDHAAPRLADNRAVKAALLRDSNSRMLERAARGSCHRPNVQLLHPNNVKSSSKLGRSLFYPVPASVGFPRFNSRYRQLGALSAVGATFGTCQALL